MDARNLEDLGLLDSDTFEALEQFVYNHCENKGLAAFNKMYVAMKLYAKLIEMAADMPPLELEVDRSWLEEGQ